MKDYIFEFETDLGEGDPGGEPEPEPTPEPEAEPEAAWTGPSQDEWTAMTQFQQQVTPFLQSVAQAIDEGYQPQVQPEVEEGPDFDPLDPDSMQAYIQQNIERGVAEALTPFQGVLGMVASERGEQLAKDELELVKSEIGEFDQDLAFLVSSGMVADPNVDPGYALRQGATFARDHEAKIRADERAKVTEELRGLSGAPGEIPAGQGSATDITKVPTGPMRYHEAIARGLARRRPSQPVG